MAGKQHIISSSVFRLGATVGVVSNIAIAYDGRGGGREQQVQAVELPGIILDAMGDICWAAG